MHASYSKVHVLNGVNGVQMRNVSKRTNRCQLSSGLITCAFLGASVILSPGGYPIASASTRYIKLLFHLNSPQHRWCVTVSLSSRLSPFHFTSLSLHILMCTVTSHFGRQVFFASFLDALLSPTSDWRRLLPSSAREAGSSEYQVNLFT